MLFCVWKIQNCLSYLTLFSYRRYVEVKYVLLLLLRHARPVIVNEGSGVVRELPLAHLVKDVLEPGACPRRSLVLNTYKTRPQVLQHVRPVIYRLVLIIFVLLLRVRLDLLRCVIHQGVLLRWRLGLAPHGGLRLF